MVIARALGLVMLLAGIAHAAPPQVPMLLVDAPPSFDATRFSTSLETYVTNAMIVVTRRATSADPCADAIASAGAIASSTASQVPVALWARWSESEPATMTVSMVTVDKGCGAAESSTVDVPPEQPDFVYRVAALKVASLLRALPEAPVQVAPPAASKPPVAWVAGPARVPPTSYGTVELGATGVASTVSAARTYALVAGVWLKTRVVSTPETRTPARFMVGMTLIASAAHDADAAGGSGTARVFGALVGGRAVLVRSGALALVGEIGAGVASVWSSAERSTGADAMSERVWTPIGSLAPHVRLSIARPLSIAVGPTVDVSRPIDLTLGDTALYRASWLRFRWDIRAQLWF